MALIVTQGNILDDNHPEDDVDLPLSVEEIDEHWLTRALAVRHPDVEVTSLEVGPVMWGALTKVWVTPRYNEQGKKQGLPPSLVIKGGFDEHSRSMAYMYDNERRFYRHI